MSRTIDEKVVEMQFDNRHFERNVSTTMSTIDKLKHSLNFAGASKGLENIDTAAKRVNMSGLSSAVDTIHARFSALEVMGVTALANITNSAVNAGKRMLSALTIDPIKTGFSEYETQINAVQTILANTKSKGTNLDDVNGALDELNEYADKTIYNFTEMTKNIGTFTAAGVDLDKSVTSIKGIANLAAVSGSTSQQASTAMYQLSQALAAGKVSLMDWNSVVNAGMGGEVFQNALKRTAENMGTNVDAMIEKYGSFRESLTKGEWLTAEVLTETLTQLSGAYSEADLIAQGYTKKQAEEIIDLAKTAESAATDVKTFTQLWDTLKETAQSGWTQTWELLVGDFEEAKSLLSSVSKVLGNILEESAKTRNELLKDWKEAGGRSDLLDSFKNIYESLKSIIKPINEAFQEIFPPVTVEQLTGFTEGIKKFTEKLTLSSDASDALKRIFKGVFSILDIGRKVLVSITKAIGDLLGSDGVMSLGTFLLDSMASLGDFFTSLNEGFDTNGLSGMLSRMVDGLSGILDSALGHVDSFADGISAIGEIIEIVVGKMWDALKAVFTWVADNVSAGDIFAGLAGGGIFVAAKKFSGFLDNIIGAIKDIFGKDSGLSNIREQLSGVLSSVRDSLNAFSLGVKVTSLVSIAVAVGILSMALRTISNIDTAGIVKSLLAIGIMLGLLALTMKSITQSLASYGSSGLVRAGISLMLIAAAITILANAMEKIAKLSLKDIGKGLIGIGGGLLALSIGLKIIGKTKIAVSTSIAMLALAASCSILGDALHKYAELSWDEIGRGLAAMGGALIEFVATLGLLNKFGGGKSIFSALGLLIAVQSLQKLADGLKSFAEMTWDEIKHGLVGMGGALAELGIVLGGLGKFAGFSSIFASGAILIVIQGLAELADALKSFGEMTWDAIIRGLTGMGGALTEVAVVSGALGKLAGFSGIFGSGAILITIQGLSDLADALKSFGEMTWDEIIRGLSGMGGALVEVGIVSGALGKITGLSGLLGSGAILLGVQGLGDLADAFKRFGEMTWDEIKHGLVGMGGALAEVSIVSGALGGLTGLAGLVGAGTILIAVQGLGDIADALKKFGEMSWDEIKRGLSAMGGALGEIALGGFLNTLSGLGAMAISEIATSLGDLAGSVQKWKDVSVPEGLGKQLGQLAQGVEKFTLAGLGAGALSTASASLGVMADSVKKWTGVTVPESLGTKLGTLADGVEKFTLSGIGAGALAEAAPAVGTLATSVKKWKDVTVPENIQSDLSNIASGVKAFSFAFAGGWSISALVNPLSELPSAIKKWTDITVPEGLETNLKALAGGVKAFSFAFAGGWSMETVIGPLGDLSGSIKKWADVTIPEGLGDNLKILAGGIKSFAMMGDISYASSSVESLVGSIQSLSLINFQLINTGLSGLADSIGRLGLNESISASLSGLGNSIVTSLITPITTASTKFSQAGANMITSIVNGMTGKQATVVNLCSTILNAMLVRVKSTLAKFQVAGIELMSRFINGVLSQKSRVSLVFASTLSESVTIIRGYQSNFYAAGSYLVDGFVAGIDENTFKAEAQAAAMAKAAADAAAAALDINSPSKVFRSIGMAVPEGFAQGIGKLGNLVSGSVTSMTDVAINTVQDSISRIADVVNSDIDTQPTIRPVLDLSDVWSGAGAISNMFGSSVGVMAKVGAISSSMNGGQNGGNSDVVSAIDKLRKDLGNLGGTSYSVNGITYDDGSNITEAVRTIVRAAKIGGRV